MREEEIAVESMLRNQDLLVVLTTAYGKSYKRMWLQAATEQHEGVCPFTSIIKDQTAKARSLEIKCVSLLDINFDGFCLAKLYQEWISHLHVVMKKIYNFPEKSKLLKSILPVKISWLIFSSFSGVEMKNLERSEQAHSARLVSQLRRSISRSWLPCVRLCSNISLLAGFLGCSYSHHLSPQI